GTRVPALTPEDAAARVGGPGKLRAAITDESSGALVAEEVCLGPIMSIVAAVGLAAGPAHLGIGGGAAPGALAVPVLTSYSVYNGARLATSSQQRLDAISFPESRLIYFSTAVRKKVFIYFPQGHYRRLETTLHLRLNSTNYESDQTISQKWPAESK